MLILVLHDGFAILGFCSDKYICAMTLEQILHPIIFKFIY